VGRNILLCNSANKLLLTYISALVRFLRKIVQGKWYLVKHNCVTVGVFIDYNGQLHVSPCTGHLQFVLGELKILIKAYSKILS